MAMQTKLNADGICSLCDKLSLTLESIQCFTCKLHFHTVCPNAGEAETLGTKSFFTAYNRSSTKGNFKFFCNPCLTKLENDMADSEANRLNTLETNMDSINAELTEIKSLLAKQLKNPPVAKEQRPKVQSYHHESSIWFNKDKLATVKVSPSEPVLVVNNAGDANKDSVEKAIMDNAIPVTKTYINNAGDLVLVCDTTDSRDKLKEIIATNNEEIHMKEVSSKRPSITIVGLSKSYNKEEIISQIVSQNQFVRHFSMANTIEEHIEIFDVKPTRSNNTVFQAFASVSNALRKGFKNYNDKIVIGLMNCKIYDRHHVKRCNNCQVYGHYYKNCPTPNVHCCAKCGDDHATNVCISATRKCINCSKAGTIEMDHAAYDRNCPCLLENIKKKKNSNEKHLNMKWSQRDHH